MNPPSQPVAGHSKVRNKKMRVLIVTRAHSIKSGGMERLSAELYQALQQQPDIEVNLMAHEGPRWAAPFFVLKTLPRLLYRARYVDVVHLGDPLLSVLGWAVKKALRKPVSVTVHGLDITYAHPLYRRYLAWFFYKFDAYIAISGYVQQLLTSRPVTGLTTVINPAAADTLYSPQITREQLQEVLPDTKLYQQLAREVLLFTAGRLVKRKGHAWFITHVLPGLPARTHYLIAGDGPERSAIRQAAAAAGMSERVHLLGRVSREHLKILYNTIDIFVQPSIPVPHDTEGFGLVLLEAALCKKMVFCADLEGMSDAIHDGQNGILLPHGSPLAWQRSLATLITQGEFVRHEARTYTLATFSWPRAAAQHSALWHTLNPSTQS